MAIAGQDQARQVGVQRVGTGQADGFNHAQGRSGDGLLPGFQDRTGDHDFLAGKTQHAQVHLRALDVLRQPLGDKAAQFLDRLASGFNIANVGVEQRAIRANQTAVGIDLLLCARRSGQFRMVPYRDVEHIIGTNAVGAGLVGQQLSRQPGTGLSGGVLGNEFWGDRNQLDSAAFRRAVAHDLTGVHILTRCKHTTLQGKARKYSYR
ncbi:hypothetical protein D3C84_720490 [compost metagenome]